MDSLLCLLNLFPSNDDDSLFWVTELRPGSISHGFLLLFVCFYQQLTSFRPTVILDAVDGERKNPQDSDFEVKFIQVSDGKN